MRVFCAIAMAFFPLSAIAQSPEILAPAPEMIDPGQHSDVDKSVDRNVRPLSSTPLESTKTKADTRYSVCLMVEAAARSNGLPVEFFTRVIWQESRFRSDAVGPPTRSGRQAQGIAQFMPGTALDRNLLDPFNPVQALPKAAEFLRDLRIQFGNRGLAAAAYNAGPRRVREWITGTGSMPLETRNYVQSITGMSIDAWAKHGSDTDERNNAGPACDELMALLKRAPNPFVEALEKRIVSGSTQPWNVILTAGFSRAQILNNYAKVQQSHIALLGYDAFITQIRLRSRGPIPFYQVRIGVPDRSAAYGVCGRIRLEHGACVILRPTRA